MNNKIDIKIYTIGNKYTKKFQEIVDTCDIHIIDDIAHYNGSIDRTNWKIHAVQMRCNGAAYKPEDILNAIDHYGYSGSKASLDNWLSKFSRDCGFKYPAYERRDDVRLSKIPYQTVSDRPDDGFGGEPIDIYGEEQFNDYGFSQRNAGKIYGDGDETDLMFKDYGVPSEFDDEREGWESREERALLNRLGR